MRNGFRVKTLACLLFLSLGTASLAAAEEVIGKNPGEFKGRWLKVYDREDLGTWLPGASGRLTGSGPPH